MIEGRTVDLKKETTPVDSQKNQTTVEPIQERTENVGSWVTSPEGQEAIAASLQRARTLAARFREAEHVKPETLLKPFDR